MWAQLSGGEVDRIITHPEILKIGGVTYSRQTFTDAKKLKSLRLETNLLNIICIGWLIK